MPQLGESIAEATIISQLVQPGQTVHPGDDLFEVETSKAVMSVSAPCQAVVGEIQAKEGTSYPVGALLCEISVSAEAADKAGLTPAKPAEPAAEATANGAPAIPAAPPPPAAAHEVPEGVHFNYQGDNESFVSSEPGSPVRVEPTVGGLPVPAGAAGATYMSPRMRARMMELGMNAADLAGVAGSGAAGRVTVEDFEAFLASLDTHGMTKASPMRIAVADSMRRSWTRPLATVGTPVILDALLAHRRAQSAKSGPALYAVRALGIALAENPALAGRLIGSRVVHPKAIDIGFAVEVEDGVLVPVLKGVDQVRLTDLLPQYDRLVEMARRRRLPPDRHGPGAATVTNFGTFGITWATPIPLPEQNLVLGLGAGRKKPYWSNEVQSFIPVTEAEITLSFDHRVLDGGAAGRLLARVNALLQRPEEL